MLCQMLSLLKLHKQIKLHFSFVTFNTFLIIISWVHVILLHDCTISFKRWDLYFTHVWFHFSEAPIREPYMYQSINLYWIHDYVSDWVKWIKQLTKKSAWNVPMRMFKNVLSHPKHIRQKMHGESWDLGITNIDEYLLHHESYWKTISKIFLRN